MSNSNIIVNLVFEIMGNEHDLHTNLRKYLDKCDLLEEKKKTHMTCAKMAIPTPPLGDLTYKSQKKFNEVSLSPRSLEYGDRTGQVRLPEKGKGQSS